MVEINQNPNLNEDENDHSQERSTDTSGQINQLSGTIGQESKSSESVHSAAVVSHFEDPAMQLNQNQQVFTPKQSTRTNTDKNSMPVGMSASQLGLDYPSSHLRISWWGIIKTSIYLLIIVLIIVGGILFWKDYLDGMSTKTVSRDGYTYSFTFFRSAKFKTFSNGLQGFSTPQQVSAFIAPVANAPQYCAEMGVQYTQAFTVQLNGVTRNVCKYNVTSNLTYAVGFSSQGHDFVLVVVYDQSQNSTVYPKLPTIFESAKVSKSS